MTESEKAVIFTSSEDEVPDEPEGVERPEKEATPPPEDLVVKKSKSRSKGEFQKLKKVHKVKKSFETPEKR